jgi:hypothetical protein
MPCEQVRRLAAARVAKDLQYFAGGDAHGIDHGEPDPRVLGELARRVESEVQVLVGEIGSAAGPRDAVCRVAGGGWARGEEASLPRTRRE